jgi:hypothetical protein
VNPPQQLISKPLECALALEAGHNAHQAQQQAKDPEIDIMQVFPVRRHEKHGCDGNGGGDAQNRLFFHKVLDTGKHGDSSFSVYGDIIAAADRIFNTRRRNYGNS